MPLRTPRRRISPRTKRRYRAIRNFFRRTLGSNASQPNIKINSSIAFNVTDLKHKIVGIEHQLDEVSRHCRDLTSFENISRREIESVFPMEENNKNSSVLLREQLSERKSIDDTKVLYKTEEKHLSKPYSACETKVYNELNDRDRRSSEIMNNEVQTSSHHIPKVPSKKNRRDTYYEEFSGYNPKLRKHRTQVDLEDSAVYTGSYHSLAMPSTDCQPPLDHHMQRQDRRRAYKEEYIRSPVPEEAKMKRHKNKSKRHKSVSPARLQDDDREKSKSRYFKAATAGLDQDFIAEIIKRQYRPVKLFGRRASDLSQISSPVCRDQEYPTVYEDEKSNNEPCSCCVTGRTPARCRHARASNLSDMRSLCDTRLYRPRPRRRTRSRHGRQQLDIYNDTNYYDVIPVKEKSSPKSRRKFAEDNVHYEYLREVPPSPRSQRPRLNLQAQNYDYEGYAVQDKQSRRRHSPYQHKRQEYVDTFRFRDDISSENSTHISYNEIQRQLTRHTRNAQIQEDMSSVQDHTFVNDNRNTTPNENLNKSDSNNDKTDKALCEIKDILQSFLQEIKKESTASQCDKSSDMTGKTDTKQLGEFQGESTKEIPSAMQSSGQNYGLRQCGIPAVPPPYVPGLTNPCCYPVMCPMNCLQNGFLIPSPSFTCHGCTNSHKDSDIKHSVCSKENSPCEANTTKKNSETEDLIREIYKFVANPSATRKDSFGNNLYSPRNAGIAEKMLTSRGVGKSRYPSKHDANVGTPPRLCCSKSCEAIGSRNASDSYYSRTNASYSDTFLEKLSLEVTPHSTTAYDTSESTAVDKRKRSKFASVLQSFGLLKKNKKNRKDVIEELSESESTTEADVNRKHGSPFRQNVTNYMMHEQEYFQQPLVTPYHRQDHLRQPQHPQDPSPHCDHGCSYDCPMNIYSSPSPVNDMYDHCRARKRGVSPPCGHMRPQASAPPYPYSCDHRCSHNMQPQVPLCLKEIEVKSTGTQSERKLPFFRKFSQKVQPPRDGYQKTNGTQTAQKKPGLWQELQAKAAASKFPEMEPFAFTMKGQKKLAKGDVKMRDAVLKKMFYKRNPFSPRNLIVRTLLGKDKSSWGLPPSGMVHRPKMFL